MIDRLIGHAVTLLLAAYWSAAFACLSAVCVLDLERGVPRAADLLGFAGSSMLQIPYGLASAAILAVVCASATILFVWGLLTLLMSGRRSDCDSVFQLAYLSGGGVLILLMVFTVLHSIPSALPVIGTQLAVLAVSYMAMNSERVRRTEWAGEKPPGERSHARLMAVNTAHTYADGQPAQVLPFLRWPKGEI